MQIKKRGVSEGTEKVPVPKSNLLRKINELIDFSFVYNELINNYCTNNGRGAVDPICMFKYLLLKVIYDLSDIDVVERSKYDMSFKYFLNMASEDEVIDASSLTKFRKLRLKDMNLLDLLINKTVEIAIEKGIIKSKSIIVDSTHIKARYTSHYGYYPNYIPFTQSNFQAQKVICFFGCNNLRDSKK